MKIRNPKIIRGAAWLGAQVMRAWLGTVRMKGAMLGPEFRPNRQCGNRRFIYSFWHEMLLLPGFQYRNTNVRVLISQHADGELIAQICRRLGYGTVRGSTTHGGAEALLEMIRHTRGSHLAITPDGPRGPRRVVQQGIVFLAALTKLPVVPLGLAYGRCWRAKSWDRFALPRPFSTAYGVTAEPVYVPAKGIRDPQVLEHHRMRIQCEMDRLTELAEQWAATGRLDISTARAPEPLAKAG